MNLMRDFNQWSVFLIFTRFTRRRKENKCFFFKFYCKYSISLQRGDQYYSRENREKRGLLTEVDLKSIKALYGKYLRFSLFSFDFIKKKKCVNIFHWISWAIAVETFPVTKYVNKTFDSRQNLNGNHVWLHVASC